MLYTLSLCVCVLTVCHVGPDVLLKLRLLRMKRLLGEMSVPRTLSPTRCPWTLATTSVVAPSSPASGCCLPLTATTRKCIKLTFETLPWIQPDLWLFSFTLNLPFLKKLSNAPSTNEFIWYFQIFFQHITNIRHSFFDSLCFLASRVQVRLGEHNIAVTEGTEQWIDAAKIIIYPYFNTYNLDNDIMLIKLSYPATLNSYVQTVALPSRCTVPDEKCMVSGWGNTSAIGRK